jgi:hypothetical protein
MKIKYDYRLINIFFSSISIKRLNDIPPGIEILISSEIKILELEFPHIQVNLISKTQDDSPISFNIETIGQFDYIGIKKMFDRDKNKLFVFKEGLPILWIYTSQFLRTLTSQMGMNPLLINMPQEFSDEPTNTNNNN